MLLQQLSKSRPDEDPWRSVKRLVVDPEPPIFVFPGLITPQECKSIIAIAEPKLTTSLTSKKAAGARRKSASVFFHDDKFKNTKEVRKLVRKVEQIMDGLPKHTQIKKCRKHRIYIPKANHFTPRQWFVLAVPPRTIMHTPNTLLPLL